jgi:formylglycine-generating enzyme required for sulfatase activity
VLVALSVLLVEFIAADRCAPPSAMTPLAAETRSFQGRRWTNGMGMTFVEIPSGTFTMGSNSSESSPHEKPAHSVTIGTSFFIATTEVTQAQWEIVVGSDPAAFRGDDLPVEQVSWNDAQRFVRKLNQMDEGVRYRLPTEAEWEYSCLAGATGDQPVDLESVAWYDPKSEGATHPVAQKQPNAWGLYDMLGNVYEWCEDWKAPYPAGSVTDPGGPPTGSFRVIRGGSWMVHANRTKAHFRDFFAPDHHRADIGFRVVAVLRAGEATTGHSGSQFRPYSIANTKRLPKSVGSDQATKSQQRRSR